MLKLTAAQLNSAVYAANLIQSMEAAKDLVRDHVVRLELKAPLTISDPLCGPLMDYTIAAAEVRKAIDVRLSAARKALHDLGIELTP